MLCMRFINNLNTTLVEVNVWLSSWHMRPTDPEVLGLNPASVIPFFPAAIYFLEAFFLPLSLFLQHLFLHIYLSFAIMIGHARVRALSVEAGLSLGMSL